MSEVVGWRGGSGGGEVALEGEFSYFDRAVFK